MHERDIFVTKSDGGHGERSLKFVSPVVNVMIHRETDFEGNLVGINALVPIADAGSSEWIMAGFPTTMTATQEAVMMSLKIGDVVTLGGPHVGNADPLVVVDIVDGIKKLVNIGEVEWNYNADATKEIYDLGNSDKRLTTLKAGGEIGSELSLAGGQQRALRLSDAVGLTIDPNSSGKTYIPFNQMLTNTVTTITSETPTSTGTMATFLEHAETDAYTQNSANTWKYNDGIFGIYQNTFTLAGQSQIDITRDPASPIDSFLPVGTPIEAVLAPGDLQTLSLIPPGTTITSATNIGNAVLRLTLSNALTERMDNRHAIRVATETTLAHKVELIADNAFQMSFDVSIDSAMNATDKSILLANPNTEITLFELGEAPAGVPLNEATFGLRNAYLKLTIKGGTTDPGIRLYVGGNDSLSYSLFSNYIYYSTTSSYNVSLSQLLADNPSGTTRNSFKIVYYGAEFDHLVQVFTSVAIPTNQVESWNLLVPIGGTVYNRFNFAASKGITVLRLLPSSAYREPIKELNITNLKLSIDRRRSEITNANRGSVWLHPGDDALARTDGWYEGLIAPLYLHTETDGSFYGDELSVKLPPELRHTSVLTLMQYSFVQMPNVRRFLSTEVSNDWLALRIKGLWGRVVSDNPHANGAFYIINLPHTKEESLFSGTKTSDNDVGIASCYIQGTTLDRLTLKLVDRHGKEVETGRAHFWFRLSAC